MPPRPPVRPGTDAYHYHTYDFANSAVNPPWGLSAPQATRGNWPFYSLRRDLANLVAVGQAQQVPNIALNLVGAPTTRFRSTLELSFGNPGGRTVVITGGIHAREWIAAEIAYLIAEYLVVNYQVAPATAERTQLRDLVDNRNIRIIPMVNPDGNDRTVFGTEANDRYWRKNLRPLPASRQAWVQAFTGGGPGNAPPFQNVKPTYGLLRWASYDVPDYDPAHNVPGAGNPNYRGHMLYENETGIDLNRNMATTAWGYDCAPGYTMNAPETDTFFGTEAGGEHETSNVRTAMAAAAANISVTIDYHSYGEAILYPSETAHAGLGAAYTRTGVMLRTLIGGPGQLYQLGAPTAVTGIGYDATGTVADYAAQRHQARAFTIELDPSGNLGRSGFVLAEGQIQTVFEKNILGALAAITAPLTDLETQQVTASFQAWNVTGLGNQAP